LQNWDALTLVWALKALGIGHAKRVAGPDLCLHVCDMAANSNIPIGLYGGSPETVERFSKTLCEKFPEIQIVCKISPPFRPLSKDEDIALTEEIVNSGARILLVGLGCPKQECWMADHIERINAVMLGVGAAFDFHSGRVKRAPLFVQNLGLEWLFRLLMEPRRLWKRYAYNNSRFLFFLIIQVARFRL
jgi:N-acetylglucosaminyldiphosphoundecaprenol N-acetyl-beta-D-mannosaminyltransferase